MLMENVLEGELSEILHYFQKEKSLGSNGWPIEFYLGFYNLIREDLLKVVEESRVSSHIHAPLNYNFIALIPKSVNPT